MSVGNILVDENSNDVDRHVSCQVFLVTSPSSDTASEWATTHFTPAPPFLSVAFDQAIGASCTHNGANIVEQTAEMVVEPTSNISIAATPNMVTAASIQKASQK